MTDHLLHLYHAKDLPVDEGEVLRYAGCPKSDEAMRERMRACLTEALPTVRFRLCWREFPVTVDGARVDLGFTEVTSDALARNLSGCASVVVLAATAGYGIDRLIARYSQLEPSKAVWMQAIGAERVESLCDAFQAELASSRSPAVLRPRFSPGYGDLPLALQRPLTAVLDSERAVGVTVNESLLLSPSKSVTALIGIAGRSNPEQ